MYNPRGKVEKGGCRHLEGLAANEVARTLRKEGVFSVVGGSKRGWRCPTLAELGEGSCLSYHGLRGERKTRKERK